MKNTKKLLIIALCILIILTTVGCLDSRPIEKIGFVLSIGIDYAEDDPGYFIFTFTSPVFVEEAEENIEIISVKTRCIMSAMEYLNQIGGRFYNADHLQIVLVNSKVAANEDLLSVLDYIYRDPRLSSLAYIMVSNDPAQEILKTNFKDKDRIAVYLWNLINNATEEGDTLPSTLLPGFRQKTMDLDYGRSPLVPTVQLLESGVYLDGLALFHEATMVGHLSETEGEYFNILYQQAKPNLFYVEDGKVYGFETHRVNRKIIPYINDGVIGFHIPVELELMLDQRNRDRSLDMTEKENVKMLEEKAAEYFQREFLNVFKKMQEVNSDPLGLGKRFRNKYYEVFQEIDWWELYPYVEINVDVEVNIARHGVIN